MRLRLLIAIALLAQVAPTLAQSPTTGAIQGRVVERKSKEPMPAVFVTVSGPNLMEPQTAITDEDGRYKITELPPGNYKITFVAEDETELVRTGIQVSANETTPVFQA